MVAVLATGLSTRSAESGAPPVGEILHLGSRSVHVIERPGSDPQATPLLFIHGASGNARDMQLAFGAAFPRHRLLFVDRPGHGWSSREGRSDAAPAVQAEVMSQVLAAKGVARAIVVGHSWGGSVTAAFGVGHPEQTAGLVFLAPATHPWPGGIDGLYRLTVTPVVGRLFSELVTAPLGRFLMQRATVSVFAPDPVPEGYAEKIGAALVLRPAEWRANAEDIADLFDNVTALSPRYHEITAPTLVLSGTRDTIVLPEIHAEGLVRDIAGARLVWLPGTGHMPQHAARARVIAEIEALIGEVEAKKVEAEGLPAG